MICLGIESIQMEFIDDRDRILASESTLQQ